LSSVPAGDDASKRRRTILLVDDDEDFREMVAHSLKEHGYYVLQAENGRIALDLLHHMHGKPDLVFLDIAMPTMSGTELLEILAKEGFTPALPVVVLSAHALDAKTARRILRKPVPFELLLNVADELTASTPKAP
jgi:CheY-like chemotaxis protein